jgi:Pectate lyase superfamily protein
VKGMRKLALLSLLLIAVTAQARTKLQGYSNASATVTVYKTGTATLATIYADAVSTSKTNSFTAAADGFWFFYVDNGSYDIQFSGSGFTTYSWTDIRVAEAGVTSMVTTFGAKCDSNTDDTAAIQRAIDIAAPNKVLLPTGACVITDTLLIANHRISLEGSGPDASMLHFEPTADNKAAIKVDLATANVISLVRLKGFSIHTTDTTRLKIGIDIVDGSETVVEDIVIGSQATWRGGTNVSPFTGTGSIGIRLQGRELGTFRNVRSAGAIPLYIANNPNFPAIDLDHHKFENFLFMPYGNNPSIYVENGAILTNVTFEAGAWVLGGAGFYWPDTTSTSNSYSLVFRNIRAEQFTDDDYYLIYITNNSVLRGLRIEDLIGGSECKGVYLRDVVQTVFDNFQYFGTSECLNTDSAFDWRSSVCQTTSTVNLNSLVEVWGQGFELSQNPMPTFGRWETAFSNHTAGYVHRFMGVNQLAKTGSLTNSSTQQIPTRFGSIVLGRISIVFKGATKAGSFTVAVTSAGAYQESTSDTTITGVGNVNNKITVHYTSASNIVIRNNLGETVTYSYSYFWN